MALVPAARNRGRIPKWSEYTFQYQGGRTITGSRYIYINALCEPSTRLRLDREWELVADGGACFFTGKYDVSKQKIYDLRVNGVA